RPPSAAAVALRSGGRRLRGHERRAVRAVRGGSAAGKPGIGQVVALGGSRSRSVEAYAVLLTYVIGLRGFRIRGLSRVLVRVAVAVAVLLRPVVLPAPVREGREAVGGRGTRRRVVAPGRLRVG